ncbi:SH3 domain-containing protein Dlish-like [Branchiostoma lanceolatum]|uniref:SH3 domain-containing protein Dlish-like n=1 Tax=Branchiostoma lanceolatum TaxID=7740 RepID=UPI0034529CD6
MAFFCPTRILGRKRKKARERHQQVKPVPGRITGSDSVDTLVRVGLEKEQGLKTNSRMVVIRNFSPCVEDELDVKRGDTVYVLYTENDWIYVISPNGREGFIPSGYCAPEGTNLDDFADDGYSASDGDSLSSGIHPPSSITSQTSETSMFKKEHMGKYLVLFDFAARDENDLNVERGEWVTVLNKEDPLWFWVLRGNNQEGFVPSNFLSPDLSSQQVYTPFSESDDRLLDHPTMRARLPLTRPRGTELIALYDYDAKAPDDLTVTQGDYLYADLDNQDQEEWLWAYSAAQKKHGYVPRAYAKPPAMTAL